MFLILSRRIGLVSRFKNFSQVRCISTEAPKKTEDSKKTEAPKKTEYPKKTQANAPPSDVGPVSWKALLFGSSFIGGMTLYFLYLKRLKQDKMEQEKVKFYGKAAINGSFDLVDVNGKKRTSEEFAGRWMLVYFGFTHCPDVCPEELDKIASVVENLVKDKVDIVPLFITVDPERDTPELLSRYLKEFSDKIIGLTGTKEQVESATRSYRVYYSMGPKDKDGDYIVDHTIISYLISPKGELVDYYGQTKSAPEVENSILYNMKVYKG